MNKIHNIGFLLTSEYSCYNAAFGLANALKARGNSITFFVNEGSSFATYVVENGFQAVPIVSTRETPVAHRRKSRLKIWRKLTEHGPSVLLMQQHFSKLLEKYFIDIVLLDEIRSHANLYSIVLAQNKIPVILVSYTFASEFSSSYPPIFSSALAPETLKPHFFYRAIFASLWIWTIATKGHAHSLSPLHYVKQSLAKIRDQIRDLTFERELRVLGWKSSWSEWKRRPRVPQIVFGHRAIDWPAISSNPDRFYFGTVDAWRKGADFDWAPFELSKPIIYCNISTVGTIDSIKLSKAMNLNEADGSGVDKLTSMTARYLMVVLESFSARTDWQLVVGCGPFYEVLKNRTRSANIHLHERLPQLAILEKADLAITWGGAGTVRECVNAGVPMLVLPAWTDQFGNAARVVASNIGLRGDIRNFTSKQLIEMVDFLLKDAQIKSNIAAVQAQCNVKADILGVVAFVKHHTSLVL